MTYTDTELTTMRMRAESMIEGGAFDTDELLELLAKLIPDTVSPIGKLTGMVIGLAERYVEYTVQWRIEVYKADVDCAWLVLKLRAADGHEFTIRTDFRIADATRPNFEAWAARKVMQVSRGIRHAHAAYVKERLAEHAARPRPR